MGIKYGGRTHLAYMLGKLMNKIMRDFVKGYQVLCPVPLHWRRLNTRLYNQATLISFGLDLPTRNLLERHKFMSTQKNLSSRERVENTKRAFRPRPAKAKSVSGMNVLIVDDLLVTGATANACAKVLMKMGANRVGLVTLCRTLW